MEFLETIPLFEILFVKPSRPEIGSLHVQGMAWGAEIIQLTLVQKQAIIMAQFASFCSLISTAL